MTARSVSRWSERKRLRWHQRQIMASEAVREWRSVPGVTERRRRASARENVPSRTHTGANATARQRAVRPAPGSDHGCTVHARARARAKRHAVGGPGLFFLFFPCCKRRRGAGCLWARERCVSRFCFITSKKKSMIGVKVTVAAGRLRRIWRWCEGGGFGRSSPTSQRREGAQMRRPTTTPGIANRRFSPRGRRYGQKNRVHTSEV